MLGWGADYPDQTNFLGYHFGAGASKQFGDKFDDITSQSIAALSWLPMLIANLSILMPTMPSAPTCR